jgi:ribose 5-phosphate isomerase B
MPKVYIASDHAGYALKLALVPFLNAMGYEVEDMGAHDFNPEDDYPDYITPCAKKVVGDPGSFGVILGKSGQGEAMAANRVPGARAAVFYGGNEELVVLPREHQDANILSFGAGFLLEEEAKKALKIFLNTGFTGEARHLRRLAKF